MESWAAHRGLTHLGEGRELSLLWLTPRNLTKNHISLGWMRCRCLLKIAVAWKCSQSMEEGWGEKLKFQGPWSRSEWWRMRTVTHVGAHEGWQDCVPALGTGTSGEGAWQCPQPMGM